MNRPSRFEIVLSLCKLIQEIQTGRKADDVDELDTPPMDDWTRELFDVAADIAGVPRDNTVETDACGHANTHGVEWPYWGYCRDHLHEELREHESWPERQAAILMYWAESSREHGTGDIMEFLEKQKANFGKQ